MSDSGWTHSICTECWNKRNPGKFARDAALAQIPVDVCCFCGEMHRSGLFVREDPAKLLCKGTHE